MAVDPPIDLSSSRLIDFLVGKAGGCEECGRTDGVREVPGMTAYHYDGEPGAVEDPNRPIMYCADHAAQHIEYWDAMWAEYYASQG